MTSSETVTCREFSAESERLQRSCGLIEEASMNLYLVNPPSESELGMFDDLFLNSNSGLVIARQKNIIIDHRMENGNEIRSVIEAVETDEQITLLHTSNLIHHKNGQYYLEVHPAYIDESGELHEPPVGDSSVVPGSHSALMVLYQIAYEAVPLRSVA